jgi:glucosamine--fructose-6-phosphate aminotransferase (isomerizing)
LHAEAFSSAELRHGPYTVLGPGFPALLLAQHDATRAGVEALGAELARRGLCVMIAGAEIPGAIVLPSIDTLAEMGPILQVQSAYRLLATLAIRRGFDPDRPAHLHKVTETV